MAEKELIAARAKVDFYKGDLQKTIGEIKERLKPANLASDAWHGIKDKGTSLGGSGAKTVTAHPGAAGGAVFAVLLFFLRGPLGRLLSRLFGNEREVSGGVKADLHTDKDFDLTAPVVPQNKGAK